MGKIKVIGLILLGIGLLGLMAFAVFRAVRPKVAGIHIESNPPAGIYIQDRQVGRTPHEGTLDPGEKVIRLVPESFQTPLAPYETKVNLVAGVQTVIKYDFGEFENTSSGEIISFERVAGDETSLAVVTDPDQALLIIDGRERAFTPHKTSSISEGTHTLIISADGYRERVVDVRTHKGYKLTAVVKLAKRDEDQDIADTPTPTPTPKNRKQVEILPTSVGFLRVRENPSSLSKEIGRVEPGESYDLLEIDENTGWYRIEFEEALTGWVSNQYARQIDSIDSQSTNSQEKTSTGSATTQ